MNFVGDLVVICRVKFVGAEWRGLGTGEKMFTFADVKRGQAGFREFEIVSAINLAFVGAAVRDRTAALLFGRGSKKIVERGKTKTQILNIARFAPDVHAIEVDVRQRFLQGIKRVLRIKFGTEQSRFFGCRCHEQH